MSNVESDTLNEFKLKYKLTKWLKTMRIQTALVTSLALWVGFISVSSLTIRSTIILGAVGIFFHIFGFTMNEVKDYKYDASINTNTDHPIAKGHVHAGMARYVAWGMYILAVVVSAISPYPIEATIVLGLAVVPGHMYNTFSKTQWWSNIYLSCWAMMMVLAGALYAGSVNNITLLLATIIGIQIFVQVIEGDLKDIVGDEESVCRKLGVGTTHVQSYFKNSNISENSSQKVIKYTKRFPAVIYGLKAIELSILGYIVMLNTTSLLSLSQWYLTLYFITLIVFVSSMSMVMVYLYDRDRIKKMSSLHETSSIILIGLTVYPMNPHGGILVAVAPVAWYIISNTLLHSSPLNPDI